MKYVIFVILVLGFTALIVWNVIRIVQNVKRRKEEKMKSNKSVTENKEESKRKE